MSTHTLSMVMSDTTLLQRLWQGDEEAFEALFQRHYATVRALLARMVGDRADDLAQEVFLRLYRQPPRQPNTDIGAWLYRVATNAGYNALRGEKRRRGWLETLGTQTRGGGWGSVEASPEECVERSDRAATVRAVLARLKRRQATILALRYSDLSYREIAAAMEISVGSVGTLLARAEKAFERELRAHGGVGS